MFSTKERGFQWYQALWSILTTKHKNIKNSPFFLPQEHFPIKFFLEPSIMASPTFRAENNVLKKGWAQIALFFLKLFLKPVLEKKGVVLACTSVRAVWRIILENILYT